MDYDQGARDEIVRLQSRVLTLETLVTRIDNIVYDLERKVDVMERYSS